MARLTSLPAIEIIQGFKGTLDFAVWKGIPYARTWPRYRPANQTQATRAAAATFGAILSSYSRLAAAALAFFQEDAKDQPRTPRDIYMAATLGTLHEAPMTDFTDVLNEIRASVRRLLALLTALASVGTDQLDVNIKDIDPPVGPP